MKIDLSSVLWPWLQGMLGSQWGGFRGQEGHLVLSRTMIRVTALAGRSCILNYRVHEACLSWGTIGLTDVQGCLILWTGSLFNQMKGALLALGSVEDIISPHQGLGTES